VSWLLVEVSVLSLNAKRKLSAVTLSPYETTGKEENRVGRTEHGKRERRQSYVHTHMRGEGEWRRTTTIGNR
jgi:hypothetical protein